MEGHEKFLPRIENPYQYSLMSQIALSDSMKAGEDSSWEYVAEDSIDITDSLFEVYETLFWLRYRN
jgi:hypothetical protein